jgi:hypothetical protein
MKKIEKSHKIKKGDAMMESLLRLGGAVVLSLEIITLMPRVG